MIEKENQDTFDIMYKYGNGKWKVLRKNVTLGKQSFKKKMACCCYCKKKSFISSETETTIFFWIFGVYISFTHNNVWYLVHIDGTGIGT